MGEGGKAYAVYTAACPNCGEDALWSSHGGDTKSEAERFSITCKPCDDEARAARTAWQPAGRR